MLSGRNRRVFLADGLIHPAHRIWCRCGASSLDSVATRLNHRFRGNAADGRSNLIALVIAGATAAGAIMGWYAMRGVLSAWRAYRKAFGQDVAARLADFFLFLDPSRLWVANLLVCAGAGLIALLFTRSVALSAGVAVLALAAPRYLVALARRQRLRAFESQLPD